MKRLICISAAFLSFLIGVSTYRVYSLFDSDSLYIVREHISLSNLEKNSELYDGNKIILQEDLIVTRRSDRTLNYRLMGRKLKCQTRYTVCRGIPYQDCFNVADIKFVSWVGKEEVQLIEDIAEKNSQLEKSDVGGMFVARVEITGYFRNFEILDYDYYSVDVTEIKQLSPIRYISDAELHETK